MPEFMLWLVFVVVMAILVFVAIFAELAASFAIDTVFEFFEDLFGGAGGDPDADKE